MTNRVGPKGQVVIPKHQRDEIGIEPGDEVAFWRHDDHVPAEIRIIEAARIKAAHPLADADSFAAATSIAHDAVLWTGDPALLVDGSRWRDGICVTARRHWGSPVSASLRYGGKPSGVLAPTHAGSVAGRGGDEPVNG